jgi:replicative DNA helicase
MISFEDLMRQIENEEEKKDAFKQLENNEKRIIVDDEESLFQRKLNPIEEELKTIIEQVDEYSWSRGSRGGLKSGFDLFDEGLEGGIQPGVYLFAAQPNVGKSAMMLQIAKQVSEMNEDVFVAYFSLDDSNNELLPRWIACDQKITISQAKNPEKHVDDEMAISKRNEGIKKLYKNINRFGMYDSNNCGTSIESIEEKIKDLLMHLKENTKLMVCIDNFYDITCESKNFNNDDSAKYEHNASELKRWYKQYNIPVMCTAELRKINSNRRPTPEDLRDTVKLQYVANWIGLLYNEVGIKEENAQVYWINEENEMKMPVIELRFGKNKLGSYKGTRFYEFVPNMSFMIEATVEDCRRYSSLIYG